jgi:hypothetical protein
MQTWLRGDLSKAIHFKNGRRVDSLFPSTFTTNSSPFPDFIAGVKESILWYFRVLLGDRESILFVSSATLLFSVIGDIRDMGGAKSSEIVVRHQES